MAVERQVLFLLARLLGLTAGSGLAVGALAPVPMVGRAFVGFDVARDVPA